MADIEKLHQGLQLAIDHTRMRRGQKLVDGFSGGVMMGDALGLGPKLGRAYGEVLERELVIASLRRDNPEDNLAENLALELQTRKGELIGRRGDNNGIRKSETPVEQVITIAENHATRIASAHDVEEAALGVEQYSFRLEALQREYTRSRRG